MKIIVAGSQSITDYKLVKAQLEQICSMEDEIVCGCAKGIDTLAIKFAEYWKLKLTKMPADWDEYGKGAGFKRNEAMAQYADRLVAFWDGESKGTEHIIKAMRSLGKQVDVFLPACIDSEQPFAHWSEGFSGPNSPTKLTVTTGWIRREL